MSDVHFRLIDWINAIPVSIWWFLNGTCVEPEAVNEPKRSSQIELQNWYRRKACVHCALKHRNKKWLKYQFNSIARNALFCDAREWSPFLNWLRKCTAQKVRSQFILFILIYTCSLTRRCLFCAARAIKSFANYICMAQKLFCSDCIDATCLILVWQSQLYHSIDFVFQLNFGWKCLLFLDFLDFLHSIQSECFLKIHKLWQFYANFCLVIFNWDVFRRL